MTLTARVRVRRGDFLLDVDLTAEKGTVLAVVGPNGAGKSTLLRALAGLVALTDGRITLAGRVLDDPAGGVRVPPHHRGVGVVFQDYRLFPHLSALENVAFGLRAQGTDRGSAREQARSWLDRVGLAELAPRRPRELSGGQAQRVALARALAAGPDLLLLDEPLAALDAGTRSALRGQLRRHLLAFPGPSLLVTHDPLEAMTLADRVLVLQDGLVVQQGSPRSVASRPRSSYVGSLVGLNVYRGTAADGVLMVAGGGRVAFAGSVSGPALAAVRPSAVSLHPAPPPVSSARNSWRGTVESLEPVGDRVRVTVGGELTVLADITALAVAELGLSAGDPVWSTVKATEVDVYAAQEPAPMPRRDGSTPEVAATRGGARGRRHYSPRT